MNKHEIIIFANSVKHGLHCVAGKFINGAQWIRLVSDKNGTELSHKQAKCQNPHGTFNVKPLQKVIVGLKCRAPLPNQPENYIIDDSIWQQAYKIEPADLPQYLDSPDDLWGENDRVDYEKIQRGNIQIYQSLYLVKVDSLELDKNSFQKRRAIFTYNKIQYNLAVTDPNFDNLIQNKTDLQGILCISLGEEFKENCYKLVATIF